MMATMELSIFWTLLQSWKVSLSSNEKHTFQLQIKSTFILSVMSMEVAETMITVILHLSFTRMENLTAYIVFMKNNALGRSTSQ